MSDDLSNLFDDDSLLPDWLQDNSASDADDAGDSGDSTDAPPWEQMFGEAPAAPDVPDSGGARDDVAPPWEQAPGPPGAPAAPAEPDAFGAAPPWAQSPADAGTPAAAAAGKDIFSGEMTWGTGSPGTPSAPAGEIPRGLTGELPWMGDMPPRDRGAVGMPSELADLGDFDFGDSSAGADPGASGVSDDAWLAADLPDFGAADTGAADDFDAFDAAADDDDDAWLRADLSQPEPAAPEIPAAPPDQPSMAELAGLRDEQFTFDSLLDEFDIDEVPEPPAPAKLPSLRDRLLADMPEPDDFDDFAEQDDFAGEAGADDLDWLAADDAFDGAFGGALDEPEAPAEPEFPRASSPIRRLEPLAPPSEPDSGLDDFDFDDLPSLDDLVPDETLDEYGFDTSSVPQIDDQTLDAMLATLPDTKPGDAPGGMTDWLDGTLDESGAAEPEPPPEPKRSGGVIRRLGGAPPPAPEPEPELSGDGLIPDWLSQADEFGDTGADDLTYEEWERRQIEQEIEASKTPEDRLLENVPEWFADGADAAKAPLPAEFAGPEPPGDAGKGPEFVPGWFLGLEEQDEEETPDWLKDVDYSADALAAPPPDLMAEPPPAPAEPVPADMPDWFTGQADELSDIDWDATFGGGADDGADGGAEDGLGELPPAVPELPAFPPPVPPAVAGMPDWDAVSDDDLLTPELGQVPDWLRDAAPVEMADEMAGDMPLPDLGALFDTTESDTPLDAVFDAAEGDVVARPEDVPFPDLDLDQTMPTGGTEQEEFEGWMADFRPDSQPGRILLPSTGPLADEGEDFVETFDPLLPDDFAPAAGAPLDDDSPAWLREMGDGDDLSAGPGDVLPVPDDIFGGDAPDALDWLQDLSEADLDDTSGDLAGIPDLDSPDLDVPEAILDMPAEAPMDSAAISQLLGLTGEADIDDRRYPADLPVPMSDAAFDSALEMVPDEWSLETGAEADPGTDSFEDIFGAAPDTGAAAADEPPDLTEMWPDLESGDVLPEELFPQESREPSGRVAPPDARPVFRDRSAPSAPGEDAGPAQPGWVSELRPTNLPVIVKAGGAELNVQQRQVAELPDRLRDLHALTGRELPDIQAAPPTGPAPDHGSLAGLTDLLPLADLVMAEEVLQVEGLRITPEQQFRLGKLQAMLDAVDAEGQEAQAQPGKLEFSDDFSYTGELEPAAARQRARRPVRYRPDRLLIAVLVLVALIVPFVTDALHVANDPAALGGESQGVADAVDALAPGDYVLFAFEYAPTAAGELDALAEAVMRDVLAHNAIPLTISTNALGAFHAQSVIEPLLDDTLLLGARGQGETELVYDQDYVTLRYLPGEAVGVRTLRSTKRDKDGNLQVHPAFRYDLRGDETSLTIGDIAADLALLVVIGEESGDVRTWAEQLDDVPLPKVALVAAAIEPLAVPYLHDAAYTGLLAGVRDTYRYNKARNTASREPFIMPDNVPDSIPNPEDAAWHSMTLGVIAAAGVIALGMTVNLMRALRRRRRR